MVPISAFILDMPINIIIGRPTIKENNLLHKCYDQILDGSRVFQIQNTPLVDKEAYIQNDVYIQLNMLALADDDLMQAEATHMSTGGSPPDSQCRQATVPETTEPPTLDDKIEVTIGNRNDPTTMGIVSSLTEISAPDHTMSDGTPLFLAAISNSMLAVVNTTTRPRKKDPNIEPLRPGIRKGDTFHITELIQYTDDGFDLGDTINHPDDDPIYGTDLISLAQEEWQQVAIHGSSDLQSKIRTVLKQYKNVFRSTLPKQHAKVSPLQIDVDVGSWVQPSNQGPHRRQSINKDIEINRQIHTMLDASVVRESQTAHAWSQVLLTLKPNGKWRFCIDFRQLNKLIQDKGWP